MSWDVIFLQLVAVLALVLIDVVVSVAGAIKAGRFDWGKLLCFLRTNVVPYVLIWGTLAAVGQLADGFGIADGTLLGIVVLVDVVYALIIARLAASILAALRELGITK